MENMEDRLFFELDKELVANMVNLTNCFLEFKKKNIELFKQNNKLQEENDFLKKQMELFKKNSTQRKITIGGVDYLISSDENSLTNTVTGEFFEFKEKRGACTGCIFTNTYISCFSCGLSNLCCSSQRKDKKNGIFVKK